MKSQTSIGSILATVVLGSAMFLIASPAKAQAPRPSWNEEIQAVQEHLQAGRWEEARLGGQYLSEALAEHCGGTPADHRTHADELGGSVFGPDPVPEAKLLGHVAALRAVAEAELGRFEEARWHWYEAQNLSPRDVQAINLANFGEAGQFLRVHMLTNAQSEHAGLIDVLDPVHPEGSYWKRFKEPVRTKVVYPRLPRDLFTRDRFSETVDVQITVDASGQVVQPLMMDGGYYPGLIYRAFEALREWRYQPAQYNGKPVAYRYIVPVVFADDRPQNPGTSF